MRCSYVLVAVLSAVVLFSSVAVAGPTEDFENLRSRIETAVGQGHGELAADLMCDVSGAVGAMAHEPIDKEDLMSFLGSCTEFQHHRYGEVFQPPASLRDIFPPEVSWESLSLCASVVGRGYGWGDDDVQAVGAPGPDEPGRLMIPLHEPWNFTVDLDLDGTPEVSGTPEAITVKDGMTVVRDVAPDGRRMQWLVGLSGGDLRAKPEVWIYRDGSTVFVAAHPWRQGEPAVACGFCAR